MSLPAIGSGTPPFPHESRHDATSDANEEASLASSLDSTDIKTSLDGIDEEEIVDFLVVSPEFPIQSAPAQTEEDKIALFEQLRQKQRAKDLHAISSEPSNPIKPAEPTKEFYEEFEGPAASTNTLISLTKNLSAGSKLLGNLFTCFRAQFSTPPHPPSESKQAELPKEIKAPETHISA